MGLIKAAIGDAILTSIWVFSLPASGILTGIIATAMGIQAKSLPGFFITTVLASVLVLFCGVIGKILGGASFNPASTVTFYASGLNPECSLLSMAVRFPAQAAGAVLGAKAILQAMPQQFKPMLRGPSLKVDLHKGAIAEGVLSLTLNFALLLVMLRGPKNIVLKVWLVTVATVGLAMAGAKYTGPAMNPANAFGWAYVNDRHNSWEQFYVYWICPLVGALAAARIFRIFFLRPAKKQKKA